MDNFCNINITDISKRDLFETKEELQILVPMNAECFVRSNQDLELQFFINETCRTTIDGQISLWLYKSRFRSDKIEKISGSDVVYDFCNWAEDNNLKVFFLGGKQSSNANAVLKIKEKNPHLLIDGYSPPFEGYPFSKKNNDEILIQLTKFDPDIIFVGFGFGKQERWISDNMTFLKSIGIKWAISCGGTFEFISGEIKRAPKFIQRIGMEGLWRLIMEPKLFRVKRLLTSLKIFKYAYTK